MVRALNLEVKYGEPYVSRAAQTEFEQKYMIVYNYPEKILTHIPQLGKSIYIHRDFQPVYEKFLLELINRELHREIKGNDQSFCVRYIRGGKDWSIHTWGMAVDLNPSDNPLGKTRIQAKAMGLTPFTDEFQQCGRDCGLDCGIDFNRPDGMHFQIKFI